MYFEWTLYIIEGALLCFGAFLSFETRHVSQFSVFKNYATACHTLFVGYTNYNSDIISVPMDFELFLYKMMIGNEIQIPLQ